MGVMRSPARVVLALVVISALVSCTFATFAGYDGLPRPSGFDIKPTTTLGAKPAVKYAGKPASCIWYSWENNAYNPTDTKNCSSLLWTSLTTDPSGLEGYSYYAPTSGFYDPTYQQYLCVIGCFDLSASGGPSPAPSTSAPPAKPPVAATPPPAMSPSPATLNPVVAPAVPPSTPPSTPPSMMAPPPPATLFRPPPPGLLLPPSSFIVPPTTGPAQAPGPAMLVSAGSALRIFSASSILAILAALLGFTL